jgi:hypothetical protein
MPCPKSRTAILHRPLPGVLAVISTRRRVLRRLLHRVHRIDDEDHQQLLEMRAIADHRRQPRRELAPHGHAPVQRVTGGDLEHMINGFGDIHRVRLEFRAGAPASECCEWRRPRAGSSWRMSARNIPQLVERRPVRSAA